MHKRYYFVSLLALFAMSACGVDNSNRSSVVENTIESSQDRSSISSSTTDSLGTSIISSSSSVSSQDGSFFSSLASDSLGTSTAANSSNASNQANSSSSGMSSSNSSSMPGASNDTSQSLSSISSSSQEGDLPLSSAESTAAHTHTCSPDSNWESDDENHWKNATCGHDVRVEEGPHQYVAYGGVEPTYESDGYQVMRCVICDHEKRIVEPMLIHHYSDDWSSDSEHHWHACTDRGWERFKEFGKDLAPHDFDVETVTANYEHGGYTTRTCRVCGYSVTENRTPQLQHNYSSEWSSNSECHWHACIDEGYEGKTNGIDAADHEYGNWIVDSPATTSQNGLKHKECIVCGHQSLEPIPKADTESSLGFIPLKDGSGYTVFATDNTISGIINIPSEHNNLPVKGIGLARTETGYTDNEDYDLSASSFRNCTQITKVNMPDSIEFIGEFAFCGCDSLTRADIPHNVKYVGQAAFANCHSLSTIYLDIPSVAEPVDDLSTFTWWPYETFGINDVPQDVREYRNITLIIGEHCDINDGFLIGLNYMGFAVRSDTGWEGETVYSATLSTMLFEITDLVVEEGNPFVTKEGNALYRNNGTELVWFEFTKLSATNKLRIKDENVIISNTFLSVFSELVYIFDENALLEIDDTNALRYIGSEQNPYIYLFKSSANDTVTTCVVQEGCKRVFYSPFRNLSNLTSVVIPSTLTSLDGDVFSDCSGLESITVSPDNPDYSSYDGALFNKGMTEIVYCPRGKTSYVIPNGVNTIKSGSFSRCSSLESVTIPDTVTTIGAGSFSGCSSLETIIIPESVSEIPWHFCANCTSLKTIKILNPEATLDRTAFAGCWCLEAFYGTIEQWLSVDHDIMAFLQWRDGALTGEGIHLFLDGGNIETISITLPDGLVSVENSAFSGFEFITSVVISDSVLSIGNYAFSNCYALESVTIGSGVASIGESAFECFLNSSSLTTINFNGTVEQWNAIEIDPTAFDSVPATVIHCTDGDIAL